MSAYSVPDNQIHVMVSYIVKSQRHGGQTFYIPPHKPINIGQIHAPDMENIQAIWDCLRKANNASLFARYEGRHGDLGSEPARFVCVKDLPEPLAIIKIVQNFEYQASEASDWYESKARAICDGIKDLAIRVLMKATEDAKGRSSLPWGYDEDITPDPFFRAPRLSSVDKPKSGKIYRIM